MNQKAGNVPDLDVRKQGGRTQVGVFFYWASWAALLACNIPFCLRRYDVDNADDYWWAGGVGIGTSAILALVASIFYRRALSLLILELIALAAFFWLTFSAS